MIHPALYLVFTSGLVDLKKAPPECAQLFDDGLLQITQQGKIPCYCVTLKGYEQIVRV